MNYEERTEVGRVFRWNARGPWWETVEDKLVFVHPPVDPKDPWKVEIASTAKTFDVTGDDAETRSFALAASFATQQEMI